MPVPAALQGAWSLAWAAARRSGTSPQLVSLTLTATAACRSPGPWYPPHRPHPTTAPRLSSSCHWRCSLLTALGRHPHPRVRTVTGQCCNGKAVMLPPHPGQVATAPSLALQVGSPLFCSCSCAHRPQDALCAHLGKSGGGRGAILSRQSSRKPAALTHAGTQACEAPCTWVAWGACACWVLTSASRRWSTQNPTARSNDTAETPQLHGGPVMSPKDPATVYTLKLVDALR